MIARPDPIRKLWTYDTVSSGHHPRVQETTTPGTVTVEYDEIGRRIKLSATGQTDVTYTYDKNSRLKTVTQGTQTVTLAYDDSGRRTTLTYPNGVVTSYGYDNTNRLLSIDHVKTPTTVEALTYVYDAAGNRTKLTRANAAATLIPDAVSNTDYDAANQQIRFNSASTNLVYDNNGNLTSFTDASGTTIYTWNARNQLTAISGPSLSASFIYDGLGRRSSKTINSSTAGYWYDGDDILAEVSGTTPTATYFRGLSIDESFSRKQSGADEFYQTDALGSALWLTDSNGVGQVSYAYEPFGKTTSTGGSSNSFQYTGRENDQTGLYYYRARYYSPAMNRFISGDPIGLAGGLNLYAYALNGPINYSDPLGLFNNSSGGGRKYGRHRDPPKPYRHPENDPDREDNPALIVDLMRQVIEHPELEEARQSAWNSRRFRDLIKQKNLYDVEVYAVFEDGVLVDVHPYPVLCDVCTFRKYPPQADPSNLRLFPLPSLPHGIGPQIHFSIQNGSLPALQTGIWAEPIGHRK